MLRAVRTSGIKPEKLEAYEKLLATNPKVERKGATVPYTSANGHMFSYLSKDGTMALRLPSKVREEFVVKYKAKLTSYYGITQPEFVDVPDLLLLNTKELKKYFDAGFEYASSMKVRAPRPKKATAKAAPVRKRAKD